MNHYRYHLFWIYLTTIAAIGFPGTVFFSAHAVFATEHSNPVAAKPKAKKKSKTIKMSQATFRALSSYRLSLLADDVFQKKRNFVISGFTDGFSDTLLLSASQDRRLTMRWIKEMDRLKSQKDRLGYIKRENTKLKKYQKSLKDSIKRLKAKYKKNKTKSLKNAIDEEQERFEKTKSNTPVLFFWKLAWLQGHL